jgi:hypothetical protein
MTSVQVDDRLIAQWRASGYPYKLVAGDLPIIASGSTWKRAKTFLVTAGVLRLDGGVYQVA